MGISFSVLQVAFGSLKTHAWEQDKARSPNRFCGNLGVFADANLVSRERTVPSRCPLKSAWRDSHSVNKETADSSHEWGLSTMWVPEIEPRCQAWMPVTLPAVPFCWPSGGVFQLRGCLRSWWEPSQLSYIFSMIIKVLFNGYMFNYL